MKRLLDQDLEAWYSSKNRKPLILRGARQVGKSSIVRNFARKHNLELDEINLELQIQLDPVFQSLQINQIEAELSGILKRPIGRPNTILFLDEIQATPHAFAALRYFYEQRPNIPVIAAGSLLEFALKDAKFSMPVGRVGFLNLEPMSFEEFLLARGEDFLLTKLRSFRIGSEWSKAVHESLLEQLRCYLMVGGMPESIAAYIDDPNSEAWSDAQESILQTYKQDFTKYGVPHRLIHLHEIFGRLPGHVGRKVKYTELGPNLRSNVVKEVLDLFTYARIIREVFHTAGQGIPLGAQVAKQHYKIYFLDVGLLCRGSGVLPTSRLFREPTIFEGTLAEQFVSQELAVILGGKRSPELYYWQREAKQSNAEIDFLMQHDGWIVPIEVKSGTTGQLKSLQQFMISHQKQSVAVKLSAMPPKVNQVTTNVLTGNETKECRFKLITLPIYMTSQLKRILEESC